MRNLLLLLVLIAKTSYAQQPNIVLIVTDDLGQQDLETYGNPFIETPSLNSLASEGALFTKGYASQPICSPTRASIITGSYPARVGMTAHLGGTQTTPSTQEMIPASSRGSIPSGFPAIATMLKSEGYETAHIGKWHVGGSPGQFGYDLAFGGGALPNTYYYPFFNGNRFPELTNYANSGDFLTDVLTNRAIDFITDNQNESFFLHLNYYAPHVPIEGRVDLVEKYLNKAAQTPDHNLPNPHYAAMVEGIDENIGRLVSHLKSLDLFDNTLVVFTSDNGALHVEEVPQFAEHTPPVTNRPLRAGKGHLYEGGTLVPYIIAGYTVGQNQVVETPVISNDFFNTFASLAGSTQSTRDGINVYPLTQGETIDARNLYWHYPHYSPQRGKPMSTVIAGDYKLLKWAERDRIELFNLKDDLSEAHNLAFKEPSLADSLESILEDWLADMGALRATPNPNYDDRPVSAIEPFDYYPGDDLAGQNSGSGWVYNWTNSGGEELIIGEHSLAYDSIESSGGRLVMNPTNNQVIYSREFLNLVKEKDSYWVSFLIQCDQQESFGLRLQDQGDNPIFSIEGSRTSGFALVDNQNNVSKSFDLSLEDTHWLVLNTSGLSTADSVLLWVDPPLSKLPDTHDADAVLTEVDLSDGISGVRLEANPGFTGSLDEIKTGFGFGDLSTFYTPATLPVDVREPFTYAIDESLAGKGADTLGWLGPWKNVGNLGGNSYRIQQGNLWDKDTLGEIKAHVRLSYLENDTQVRIERELAEPLISDGSTYWISYWIKTEPSNATGNVANLNLVNSSIVNNDGHRLSIGRIYGTGQLGLITPSNGIRSISNIDDVGLNHMVARIRTVSGSQPDTVHLWINPVIDESLSLVTASVSFPTSVLKEGIDRIRLRVEGAGAGQIPLIVSFDHLRIGRSPLVASLLDTEPERVLGLESGGQKISKITIYPNPARGELHFRKLPTEASFIQILSLDGKQVLQTTIDSANSLNVSRIPPGIYYSVIKNQLKKTIHSQKIVIE